MSRLMKLSSLTDYPPIIDLRGDKKYKQKAAASIDDIVLLEGVLSRVSLFLAWRKLECRVRRTV